MRAVFIVVCLLGVAQGAGNIRRVRIRSVQWSHGGLSDHSPAILCVDALEER